MPAVPLLPTASPVDLLPKIHPEPYLRENEKGAATVGLVIWGEKRLLLFRAPLDRAYPLFV